MFQNKINSQTESIIDLLKWNTYKIKILKDVYGNINKIRQFLVEQKKNNVINIFYNSRIYTFNLVGTKIFR